MAAIAVCSAIYGARVRGFEQQEEAFRQIASKGGWIHVRVEGTSVYFEEPSGYCGTGLNRVVEPVGGSKRFVDEDMALLDKIQNLRSVNFYGANLTPVAISEFRMRRTDCRVSIDPL